MDCSQEEINKMSKEQKVEKVINDIQDAIDENNEKEIYDYINQILTNIKNLMSGAISDKIYYIIIKFLNRIDATDPRIRANACENLDESLESGINDINFERKALLELKGYLKNCKKTQNYKNLSISFALLVAIHTLQNNRKEKINISGEIWRCGINGIRYMPISPTYSGEKELREPIEVALKKLKG